jgi:ABC-2 type transport system ATP-binding protein
MPDPILQVSHLSRSFHTLQAVQDVSLNVAVGEIYGMVGPDGAGKTTTLRLICGAYRPDSGSVTIGGFSLESQPEQARAQLGYLSQRFSLYEDLTVLENIRFLAEVRGLSRGEWLPRSRENLAFVGLDAFENRLAGRLSGGMKQKLALACALVNRPRLLLLDEPTTGVDPVTRQDFWQLIIRLAGESGLAVLVCTPYMDEASRCSRVGFMRAGKIIQEGPPSRLRGLLKGRVMELAGSPTDLLVRLSRADPAVQDAQRFGDRLHLRVQSGQSAAVRARLTEEVRAAGGQIDRLEEISPLLEDVFIDLAVPSSTAPYTASQESPVGRDSNPDSPASGGAV